MALAAHPDPLAQGTAVVPEGPPRWDVTDRSLPRSLLVLALGFLFLVDVPVWIGEMRLRLLPDFVAFALLAHAAMRLVPGDTGRRVALIAIVLAIGTGVRSLFDLLGITPGPFEPRFAAPLVPTTLAFGFEIIVLASSLPLVWTLSGTIRASAVEAVDTHVAVMAARARVAYRMFVAAAIGYLMFSWLIAIANAPVFTRMIFWGDLIKPALHILVLLALIRLVLVARRRILDAQVQAPLRLSEDVLEPTTRPFR